MPRKPRGAPPSQSPLFVLWDEPQLLAASLALGAQEVDDWADAERDLVRSLPELHEHVVEALRTELLAGGDPLGDIFCEVRPPIARRPLGATYTPIPIVRAMLQVYARDEAPTRVVDPGCGSARFLLESGSLFPKAELVGFEIDPVAAIVARGNLAAMGYADRSHVVLQDFREAVLPGKGRTLFVGNPPYVRHHLIPGEWKEWLAAEATKLGLHASQLAGLHIYFFLATVLKARSGDFGSYITSAEWLDVNYGSLLRELFLTHLGGTSITVLEPTASAPFPDAATTGAVTSFRIGKRPDSIGLSRIEEVADITAPPLIHEVRRERLEAQKRWSGLTRVVRDAPGDFVELGELCRVHRGTVTGANKVWIAGEHSAELPRRLLYPSVTHAREIFAAGEELADSTVLRSVIGLPPDLDSLLPEERERVERFLRYARAQGAHTGYVARNRKAWWAVGLRAPAPILATYMARRPPSFVRNTADARHINIAHGLYPREPLSEAVLRGLVRYLSNAVSVHDGRTYAGGLTKFEPREMERLLIPRPDVIADHTT